MKEEITPPAPPCPKCSAQNVGTFMYGLMPQLPSTEPHYESGRMIAGGCCISDDSPRWRCNVCRHTWGRLDDTFTT